QDALDRLGDSIETRCFLPMLGLEIADFRCCDGVPRGELLENHILLGVMAGIRIVLEIIDDREDDLVIRPITAIEDAQLALEDAKQFLDVAMLLTQQLDEVGHRPSPHIDALLARPAMTVEGYLCMRSCAWHCARSTNRRGSGRLI